MLDKAMTAIKDVEGENKKANLYRTRWLMSHNALHDLVHKTILGNENVDQALKECAVQQFDECLEQLGHSEELASTPA